MIAFFDTSAVVPLLIEEPGSERSQRVWGEAASVHVVATTLAEVSAALAHAHRLGRITTLDCETALIRAERLWAKCTIRIVDTGLAGLAAKLAVTYGLRGYDAVQCAGGLELLDTNAIGVAGDRALLAAWGTSGLPFVDVLGR